MIKVLIDLSDRQFGEDLAFSLSGLSDKLSIDLENKGEYDYVIDDKTEEILPVSALLDHIIGSYTEMTGKTFLFILFIMHLLSQWRYSLSFLRISYPHQ